MKKLFLLSSLFFLITLSGCTSNVSDVNQNPVVNIESAVYEISNTNFQPSNNFGRLFVFPRAILPSDHVLVYRLAGQTSQNQDIWTILPKQYFLANGTFDFGYNFDFTRFDVSIFIEGNNLNTLNSSFRLGQVFRIVIVPGQFQNKMSFSDYAQTLSYLHLSEKDIVKL